MAKTSTVKDSVLDEVVHRRVYPSGLTVYVVRKPAFTKSYATFATRYGSIDTSLDGKTRLPDGIAHFLEHKIFETPEGDAFDLFAARGASANAFTSFSSTRYLFGTSQDYAANLRTLIEVVLDLHVDHDNVEKEKGIIDQEIAMYDDDPDWRIFAGALQALYVHHPIRIDIAGTKKSISVITPELLRRVHAAYYHPRNMVLAACSPEPVGTTFAAVEELVEGRKFGRAAKLHRTAADEPDRVRNRSKRIALPVARPRLLLALKDSPARGSGKARLRRELAAAVVLDCLFGNSGEVYLDLYERGLVDDNFSFNYSSDTSYAFALAGGETDDVPRLRRALDRQLDRLGREGIAASDFERIRNKELGGYARAFNAPDRIAQMLVGHHFRGTTIADYREVLFRLTRAEVNRTLRRLAAPERRCYSTVVPRK